MRGALAAVFVLGACANEEPGWTTLEVRTSVGAVEGNEVRCSGGLVLGICDPNYALWAHARDGEIVLSTQTAFLLGVMFRVVLDESTVVSAEGRYGTQSDNDNAGLVVTLPTGGWIAPDQVTAGFVGRQTGQFHLEFPNGGALDGSYDTGASIARANAR